MKNHLEYIVSTDKLKFVEVVSEVNGVAKVKSYVIPDAEEYLLSKIDGGSKTVSGYLETVKRVSEPRKWGYVDIFVFADGFRLSAGYYNAKGSEGVTHYSNDMEFGYSRDIPQSKDFLKKGLSREDHLIILSHLSGIDVKIKQV